MAWPLEHWSERADGVVWRHWSPACLLVALVALTVVPVAWLAGAWALLLLPLGLLGWDEVRVQPHGIVRVRWWGPVPWQKRRFPPGGTLALHEGIDFDADGVVYRVGEQEHWIAASRKPDALLARLQAASRAASVTDAPRAETHTRH